jgi:hypothetical protein
VKVPISCSLEPAEAKSQLDEWQQLRRVLRQVKRVSPRRLELFLLPEADVASLVALAQKEKACCPFFAFTIEIAADHLVFVLAVPADAIGILDNLVPGEAEATDLTPLYTHPHSAFLGTVAPKHRV